MTTRITTQNITDATITTTDIAASVPLAIEWQSVKTSDFTAAAGKGYFVDTTSNTVTVTLPASGSSTAGDTIILKDYAFNWGTNACILASNKFDAVDVGATRSTDGESLTFVHMGATKGWSLINQDTVDSVGALFIAATGGTVTTSGNYKVHTFTGDSNFVVSSVGNAAGSTAVDYLVVAGGGGGGDGIPGDGGGGGGAGGFRVSNGVIPGEAPTMSPLITPSGAITVSATTYPVTVGGGGSAGPSGNEGTKGSNSVGMGITSAGGGTGDAGNSSASTDTSGGSGGGLHQQAAAGLGAGGIGGGNNPPVAPPQGNPGGGNPGTPSAGGGGGAGAAGANIPGSGQEGSAGGAGVASSITGSSVTRGGGGSGSPYGSATDTINGGPGGGGKGSNPNADPGTIAEMSGTANLGGGGGGTGEIPKSIAGGTGGKGIVILRYKFQ